METLGKQRSEAVDAMPSGGQFAQGAAKALAGEIGVALLVDNDEAAELHDEFESVGAGHRVPADPFVAVLEALGRTGPNKRRQRGGRCRFPDRAPKRPARGRARRGRPALR